MKDEYKTLVSEAEGLFTDRGSKFLAYVYPVSSEEEASELLLGLKKTHPKARHFCTAIRLLPDASLERSSDDGEPSGSAGKPILGQLIKNDLTQVFAVVVRYFGGTKLGVPGLIEAYKTSTADAIASAAIAVRKVYQPIRLDLAYDAFPHLLNYCKQNDVAVLEETFSETASLTIGLKKSTAAEELLRRLKEYSQLDFETLDEYAKQLSIRITFSDDEIIQ